MSTVDKRVVEMVFDNEQFEKNIAKSQKSLESIDKQLSTLGEDVKEEKLATAVTKGMNAAETIISAKAEIFRGIMLKIGGEIGSFFTNTLAQAQRAINNLTFDQINVGFSKYEEKLSSVQTIMNATGKSIDVVETKLQELNWYTDETSANFTDMTNNIGKFTSAGVELDDAAKAMMGISNWAYLSGANLNQASAAMYNFSQAMGTGVMMSQDWKSIENANMATKEFKQTVIETTKELYKQGKIQEDVIELYGVTAENFRSTLSEKWFTSDIMMESTKAYGAYTEYVKKIQEAGEEAISSDIREQFEQMFDRELDFDTASGVIRYLNFIEKNYTEELTKIVETYGAESDELKNFTNKLGISVDQAINMTKTTVTTTGETVQGYFYNISKRAFLAAQEYKTFADVINATTDAVSTKWMNVFQMIFGNYEEAKSVWTEMGDLFYEIFATPVDKLIEIIEVWTQFSGRKYLVGIAEDGEEVYSVFQLIEKSLMKIAGSIEKAFFAVFPFLKSTEQLGKQLAVATYLLADWAKQLTPTEEVLTRISHSAAGVFRILKGIGKVIYSIIRSIGIIVKAILPSSESIFYIFELIHKNSRIIEQWLSNFANQIWRVANIIAIIINGLKQAIMDGSVKDYLLSLGQYLLINGIKTVVEFVDRVKKAFNGVETEFGSFGDTVATIVGTICRYIDQVVNAVINDLGKAISDFMGSGIAKSFTAFLNQIPSSLGGILKHLFDIFKNLLVIIENILGYVSELLNTLAQNKGAKAGATLASIVGLILVIIEAFLEGVKEGRSRAMTKAFTELIEGLGEALKSFQNAVNAFALRQIATSILLVAVSALILAKIPSEDLKNCMLILTGSLVALVGALAVVSSFSSSKVGASGLAGILNSLQKVAIAVLIFSNIILKLMNSDTDAIKQGLRNLSSIFLFLGLFIAGLRIITNPLKGHSEEEYEFQMNTIVSIIKNITWIAVAMFILSSSFKILSGISASEMWIGIIAMVLIFGMLTKMLDQIKSISNRTNGGNLSLVNKTIIGLAGSVMVIALSLGLLIGAFTVAIAVLGILPENIFDQGISGLLTVLTFITGFLVIMRYVILGIGKSNDTATAAYVMGKFGVSMILISTSLVILSAAVGLFVLSISSLGVLASTGVLEAGMHTIMVMFALFASFALIMRFIMFINVGFVVTATEFGAFLISCAGAFAIMAVGVNILASGIAKFGEIDDTVYANGMIRIAKILAAIAFITIIAKLIGLAIGAFSTNTAKIKGPGGKTQTATSLTSIGQEIFRIGAGLALISAAITALLIPIAILSEFDDDKYKLGIARCGEVLGMVFLFLAGLVFIFGVSTGLASLMGSKQGIINRTTTEETNEAKSIFKRKGKKVTKEMKGVGEEMYQMGKALLLVAASITLLLVPIAILGKMGADNSTMYSRGLLGVSIILALIAAIFVAMAPIMKWTSSGSSGASRIWAMVAVIAALGLVVWGLIAIVKDLGEFATESAIGGNKIIAGMVAVFFILLFIAGEFAALAGIEKTLLNDSTGTKLIAIAGAIAIVAGSVIAIAFAVKMMGEAWAQDGNAMWSGLIALGVAVGVIGGILILLGDIEKASPTAVLRGAGGFAAVVVGLGLGFLLLAASLLVLQTALDKLIKTAENAKEGWNSIYQGVSVFLAFAAVMTIIIGLFALFAGVAPEVAIVVIGLAAAVFFLALAFYLVVEGLTTLSDKWDEIEVMLDKVTTWLISHSDEWSVLLGKFFGNVFKSFVQTLVEMGGEATKLFGVIGTASKEAEEMGLSGLAAAQHVSERIGGYLYDAGVRAEQMGFVVSALAQDKYEIDASMRDNAYKYALKWAMEQGYADAYGNIDWNYRDVVFEKYLERTEALVTELKDRDEEYQGFIGRSSIVNDPNITAYGAMYAGANLSAADYAGFKNQTEEQKAEDAARREYDDRLTAREDAMNAVFARYADNNGLITENKLERALATYTNVLKTRGYIADNADLSYFNQNVSGSLIAAQDEEIVITKSLNKNLNSTNDAVEEFNWDHIEDVSSGAGMVDDSVILAAQNGYGAQLANEEAIKQGTKEGTLDALYTFFANLGDAPSKLFYDIFGKEKVDKWTEEINTRLSGLFGELGASFENLTGISTDDVKKAGLSFLGIDPESEEGKRLLETLDSKTAIKDITSGVKTKMENGQDFQTALNSTLEEKGLSFLSLDYNSIANKIAESGGFDLFAQGDYSELLDKIKIEDYSKIIEDTVTSGLEDAGLKINEDGEVELPYNPSEISIPGMDDNFNYEELLKKYGFGEDGAFDIGTDYGMEFANGQVEGYIDAIKDNSDQLTKYGDFSQYTSALTGASSMNKVLRYQNGVLLEAAATVADLGLVAQIKQPDVQIRKGSDVQNTLNKIANGKNAPSGKNDLVQAFAKTAVDDKKEKEEEDLRNYYRNLVKKNGLMNFTGNLFRVAGSGLYDADALKLMTRGTAAFLMTAKKTSTAQNTSTTGSTTAVKNLDTEAQKNKQARQTSSYYNYAAAQNQKTGTSSASAAQSAASATDYLRAINERANLIYNTLVEMNTRQVDMAENLNSVANNTYACATTPIPATIDQKEVKNLAKSVNLILGMKAELSKRGV